MILDENLVAQIVEKVLQELNEKKSISSTKKLLISSDSKLSSNEVSYLNYESSTKYDCIVIDKLSLEECARIIYNIRYKDKINFILDNYLSLKMNILEIVGDNDELIKVYQDILKNMGFVFEKQVENNKEVITLNKEVISLNKKVINERDLVDLKLKENSKLSLIKKTIVTPLAKDYLRKNKITIVEED